MKRGKICAIICEYNPLHNGHEYQIKEARRLSDCEFVLCIMGGNFTQRGKIAVLNKHSRANIALQCGADAVVQIPTAYAASSAEVFALAGVKIANNFKNVTNLCFGSECGEIDKLMLCADFFENEPKEYKNILKTYLKNGQSYNSSRLKALEDMNTEQSNSILEIVKSPNNILGIEYIKALKTLKSKIEPITVKRIGEDFNSKKLTELASATAIRNKLYESNNPKSVLSSMPKNIEKLFIKSLEQQQLPDLKLFDELRLCTMRLSSQKTLKQIFDVGEGLENRLINLSHIKESLAILIEGATTKRYTEAKINRIITANMLGITKDIIKKLYISKLPYIKLLAAHKNSGMLKVLGCSVQLVTRSNEAKGVTGAYAKALIEIEEKADIIYAQITAIKQVNVPYLLQPPIILS